MRRTILAGCLSSFIAALLAGCGGCEDDYPCRCAQEQEWAAVVEVTDSAERRLSGVTLVFTVNEGEPRVAGCDDAGICRGEGGPGYYQMRIQREGFVPKDARFLHGTSTCGATGYSYVTLQKQT